MKKESKFKNLIQVIKLGKKICPQYLISAFVKSIFNSVWPFVNIIFSYLILDALIDNAPKETIYLYIGLLVGLNFVISAGVKVCLYFTNKYNNVISYRIAKAISDKNYTLDYEQAEDSEIMDLLQKARDGSNSNGSLGYIFTVLFDNVLAPVLQIVYAIVLLSGLFISHTLTSTDFLAKFVNNPLSSLVIVVTMALVTTISIVLTRIDNKASYKAMLANIEGNRKFSYLYSICANYQYGKDIRLFGMQDMIMSIMTDKKNSVDDNWRKYSFLDIKLQILSTVFAKVLLIVAYLYVGVKAYYGLISIGNVVSYVSAITLLGTSINKFLGGFVMAQHQASYLKHYFTYLNLPSKMTYGNKEFTSDVATVEFRNVSFVYPKQKGDTITNISFKINQGEKIALVGQNGAGKTTIIKLLCRLYEPTSGEILINDVDIREYTKESLAKVFGVVFQDFKLFSYSIKENIACGNEADTDLVWDALDKAGIKDRVNKMDKGIDTVIYQKNESQGVEISGGEAQKLALARALYRNSPLVILDEPTSALDPVAEAEIYEHFKDMVSHKTSIFISHRMSSCKFCDRIIVLEKGKIEEEGTHHTLLQNDKLYAQMWHAQAKYYN